MQEAYECIFLFDAINRQINVYDQSNYVHRTGIQITRDDIIKSLNVTENADDLYTAISVQGSDDLNISAINPLGGSVIYNFHYYLSWMSSNLRSRVTQWQIEINSVKDNYYQNNLNYFNKLQQISNLQAEVDRLDGQIKMYTRCKDNIVANGDTALVDQYNTEIANYGGNQIVVYNDIEDTITALTTQISGCKAEKTQTESSLATAQDEADVYITHNRTINSQLAITSYFTQSEYAELSNYIFEGSYTDNYIKVTDIMTYSEKFQQMKTLYDRAEEQLLKVSEPTQEFDVDSENVIFDTNFSHWNDQLETGCLINVELVKDDWAWLFLSTITVNYDDKNLKFTFGNRFNKYDTKSLFDKVLGSISKSANTLQYIKDVLYPLKDGTFDDMKDAIQSSRNITMAGALVSSNEEVVIDGSGYTGRTKLSNGTYDPQQIKITGKNIVFTDDAWDTAKTAIGEILLPNDTSTYGINAETVIGELLIGERTRLQNPDQTFVFDEDGINVFNDTNSFTLNPSGDTLLSIKKGNNEIFGLNQDGSLHVVANGDGIDLSTNSTILGINSSITLTAKGIKETVSSAMSKYDTTGLIVDKYGYGNPDSIYAASDYNGKYYLDQNNGNLWVSDGQNWSVSSTLNLTTANLQSSIEQTQRDIVSTVNAATSLYDTRNTTIDIYGYSAPDANIYPPENYNLKYYLNQRNGYLYKSNGSGWVYQSALTLITANLQSQIIQNINSITTKVSKGNFGTMIQQSASDIRIAWNNISESIKFEGSNYTAQMNIYKGSNSKVMSIDKEGSSFYLSNNKIGKIGTNNWYSTTNKGLVFDLEHGANYMAWAYKENSGDDTYKTKWLYISGKHDITYTNSDNVTMTLEKDTLYSGCDINVWGHKVKNVSFDDWGFTGGSYTGTFSGTYNSNTDPNGTPNYRAFSLVFYKGILRSASF